MPIDWKTMSTAGAMKTAIEVYLKLGASIHEVSRFCETQQIEHSKLVSDTIHGSVPGPCTFFFVRTKWLIRFIFAEEKLASVDVQKGHIGP